MSLKPGKGLHTALNGEMIEWLHNAVDTVWEAYADFGDSDVTGDELQDSGKAKELHNRIKDVDESWVYTKDKFGEKVHKAIEWQEGELRVTVVVKGPNELKIDIRHWYSD